MAKESWWIRRIEAQAYRRLRELRQRGLWDGSLPVPVDHVLEHLLGLSICWEPIVEDPGEQILACLRPETRQVVLNEKHSRLMADKPGIERFSKGHEAGHADVFALTENADQQLLLLKKSHYRPCHRSAPGGQVSVLSARLRALQPDVRTEVLREIAEEERRKQAAGDDSALERRAVEHYAAVLLMPEDLVRKEVRAVNLTQSPSLYRLAGVFEVTISALIVRLKELGLIFGVVDRVVLLQDPALIAQTSLL